jgi:eukaryotic-like serine/threonine-protein kinase
MELLEGRTLADEMRETGRFSVERTIAIAVPICEALAAAHDAGIVHRDVKPENIFLHRERGVREGEIVKVLDFGLAKVVGDELGLDGPPSKALAGTPAYIAPERLWGKTYDGRADVYSVGVILYRMLTGEPPFRATDNVHALIAMSVNLDPVPPRERRSDVGADVDALVMRALAKDPNARFTARDLAAALRDAAAG